VTTNLATLDQRLKKVIRQDVQSMHGYAIQPSAGLIKLDAMENPFRLPVALQRELGERLGRVAINRYPSACVADVIAALSVYVKLPAGCKMMLGNGSDELIALLALACDIPGASILAPLPGFVMYEMSAKLQGLKFIGVPLSAEFELDEAAMLAAIETHRPAITYLAYPNNPTANLFDAAAVERIVAAVGRQDGLVVFQRAELMQALQGLPGVQPFPSEANMILVRVPDSKRCFEGMKARGVLVKNIAGLHPLLANCLRLTVGAPDENVQMIDALKASL